MKPEFHPARRTLPLLLSTAFLFMFLQASSQQVARSMTYSGHTIPFLEYKPVGYDPNIQYPLIIFLHGIGERGPDDGSSLYLVRGLAIPYYIDNGQTMTFTYGNETKTFLVLSPQLGWWGNWQTWYIDAMLEWASTNLSVDNSRIYLTGISLGGGGTWNFTCTSTANAEKFAAIAPICGTPEWSDVGLCNMVHVNTAIWAFHATDDGIVSVNATNTAFQFIDACSPPAATNYANKTIYPDGNHYIWDRAYNMEHTWQSPLNLFEWFLSHSRSIDPCADNDPPIAEAGSNVTITTSTHLLSSWGSSDPENGSLTYLWSQVSGPNQATISGNIYATAQVSGLQEGEYTFKLRVTDECGAFTEDNTVVKVEVLDCNGNAAPIAEAGDNLTITTTSYLLSSWGSYDPGGGSITYQWSNVSGPNTPTISGPTYATAQVTGLVHGTYVFKLAVTDECDETTEDNIQVMVNLGQRTRTNITETVVPVQSPLRMYPNPAGDRLFLSFTAQPKERIKVSVTDLTGRMVIITEIPPALLSKGLDLTRLKPGVYIVQVESDGKKYTQQLIKK